MKKNAVFITFVIALSFLVVSGSAMTTTKYTIRELTVQIRSQNTTQKIGGVAYIPNDTQKKYPLVICSHGLGGSYHYTTQYAEEFASNGIAAYCFDFRGGGGSKSDGKTTDMSVMTEVSDLEAVLSAAKKWDFVDSSKIALLGTSQGGLVSAIVAARHKEELQGAVLLYPAFSIYDAVHSWFRKKSDITETFNFTGWIQNGRRYAEDIWDYDAYSEIKNFDKKVLLLHGDRDSTVDIKYSEKANSIYPDSEYFVIRGAGHGFSGQHFQTAMNHIWDYFRKINFAKPSVTVFAEGYSIPSAIIYDKEGNIYLSEWGREKVHKYKPNGEEIFSYNTVGDPSGLAFDDDGNLYVGSYSYGVVHRFEKGDPKRQSTYASGFDVPAGVTWIDGCLYVANRDAGEIVRIERNGRKTVIARGLPQPVCFQKVGASYIISCLSGSIYKMDNINSKPKVLCPEVRGSGINIVPDGDDGFFICVISDGTVERITLDGKRTVIADGYSTPLGIAKLPNGNLMFDAWGERAAFVLEWK